MEPHFPQRQRTPRLVSGYAVIVLMVTHPIYSYMYRVFHKKTAPFIFNYNSYNNGPFCVKFAAANVRKGMQILLTSDFVGYIINILCNEQSNQRLQIQR